MHWLITSPLGETMNISPETYKSLKVKFEFMDLPLRNKTLKTVVRAFEEKLNVSIKQNYKNYKLLKSHMLQSIFS